MVPTREIDRSLNNLLVDLASWLSRAGEEQIVVGPDHLVPVERQTLEVLCDTGLLFPCEPAKTVICDGCARACPMPVHSAAPGEAGVQTFVACDKRDDIGRISVNKERLRQWAVSLRQFAEVTARLLSTDRQPTPGKQPGVWELGFLDGESGSAEVVLTLASETELTREVLVVTLDDQISGQASKVVAFPRLISFRDCQLQVNRAVLRDALSGPFYDSRTACEIKFESGDIILVNHVMGRTQTVASPRFNSSNDNAFQALYDNPGRTFTLQELRDAARDPTLANLHKIVENLKFEGTLKKLFFRVSQDAIRFQRAVTREQLGSLGIDPKDVS